MHHGLRKFAWVSVGVGLVFACGGNSEEAPTNGMVTQTVDLNGGTLESPTGAKVVVPANGVSAPVAITVTPLTVADVKATLPANVAYAGEPTAFTPYGTTFSVPVTITIPASSEANVVLSLDDLSSNNWREVSGVEFASSRATFRTSRFALFAACRRATTSGMGGASSTGIGGSSFAQMGGSSQSPVGGTASITRGGSAAVGGSVATGGTQWSGGSPATGGIQLVGGKAGATSTPVTGGTSATGGNPATGGITSTGGRTGVGGTSNGGTSTAAGFAGRSTGGVAGVAGVAGAAGKAGMAGAAGASSATCAMSDVMTTCQICLAQKCCSQQTACKGNDTCATFYNCFSGSNKKPYATCTADMLEIPTSVGALNQCATSNCLAQCGITAG